ncbi:MAG: hypothetical protein QNJ45_19455 [Ardenticatenaceae bacterium]|nr:hypothetical protein [Ardenticatenaceae bacterium]
MEWILLAIVLIAGGILRFGWVGVNSFSFDEARVSQLALQMAQEGQFAPLGMQSSTGVPNFPAAVWLFALPYWLSTSPLLATGLVGLVSWFGILGMWWLGRQAWGRAAGLTAAALFAFSPTIVTYSRNIWSQNFLAPFAVFWALTIVIGITHPNRRVSNIALILHAFLAGFIVQIHIAGITLAIASLWMGIRYRLWSRWAPIVGGGVLAIAAAGPTVYTITRFGEGAQADLSRILGGESTINWVVFRHLWHLGISWRWERLWLNENWIWPSIWEPLQVVTTIILAFGVVSGAVMIFSAVRTTWFDPPTPGHVLTNLLPVWLICSPLFFLSSKTPVEIHYQLPSVPAVLLLAAAVVLFFRGRSWQIAVVSVTGVISLVAGMLVGNSLSLVERELVAGGVGTPLKYPLEAVRSLQDGRPIVVHAWGDQIAFDGDAAVFNVLLWDYPHRLVDGRSAVVVPKDGGHLLVTFDTISAWSILEELALPPDLAAVSTLPRRQNEPPYMAYTIESAAAVPDLTPVNQPSRLENGAQLSGWQLQPLADDRWRLLTMWQILSPSPGGQIQQFNHLYIDDQEQPSQIKDATVSSDAWQVGDRLITWADFDVPPDSPADIHFEVGMYSWPDLQRSPVLGRPAEQDPLAPIKLYP